MTLQKTNKRIKIAVVGDLLLTAKPGSDEPQRGLEALSGEIRELFAGADIVLANLECTLPSEDNVDTEPRVFSSKEQIRSIKESGINLVTLGNNHCFDGKDEGFLKLTSLLNDIEIPYFGAGLNLNDASQPAILKINGITIAFLSAVDTSSGMYRFATDKSSGVVKLDQAALCQQISALKKQYDHVIITPHWGEERFRIPSLTQRSQAQHFIDAGAAMVAGHHPHVLQGIEHYRDAPIIYSLGNFCANNVYWDNGDCLTWNQFERTGCILMCDLDKKGISNKEQITVYDNGATLEIAKSRQIKRYINKANALLRNNVTTKCYQQETFRVRALLPILNQLRWHKIKEIRLNHLRKAIKIISSTKNGG
ncbi:MAG: capsule biosynthesis protein CapA [Desulfobacteraceae bacterium 4572_35.2]|nr:MAG: capsule biosynthesis protein CapA [Desulfobacteraceae bacterium 4572_35.2]